eukprot:SAG22_NODE_3388_length_1740_cov_1.008531_1_plen_93_part_10
MEIVYVYQKIRSEFGRHCDFKDRPAQQEVDVPPNEEVRGWVTIALILRVFNSGLGCHRPAGAWRRAGPRSRRNVSDPPALTPGCRAPHNSSTH